MEPKIIHSINLKKVSIEKFNINNDLLMQKSQKILKNKKMCRICYGEEDITDFFNPLVQPCKCSGSLKYIHLNCLKKWLNTKSCKKINSNNIFSIFIVKQIQCEICQEKFPDYVKHKDSLYEILDFNSEFENFITIESLTLDKNNCRCIYVVNLDNNIKIKIGRGNGSNIILSDISVSRVHSILTIENKNIYIEDNDSKFGTLILVQSPTINLIENLPLFIQIGRTFLNCVIRNKKNNIFSCCGIHEKPSSNYYYQLNEKQKQSSLLNMFTIKSEKDFSEDYESEIDKEKDFDKLKLEEKKKAINDRYDENTLDIDLNNSKLKLIKDENEIKQSLINKKSKCKNEENKNNKNDNNEERSKALINKSESIYLESESEVIK